MCGLLQESNILFHSGFHTWEGFLNTTMEMFTFFSMPDNSLQIGSYILLAFSWGLKAQALHQLGQWSALPESCRSFEVSNWKQRYPMNCSPFGNNVLF